MQIEPMSVAVTSIDILSVEIAAEMITVKYQKRYSDPSIIATVETITESAAAAGAPDIKGITAWAEAAILPKAGAVKAEKKEGA